MWQHCFPVSHPLGPLCLHFSCRCSGQCPHMLACHGKCLCFSAALTQSFFPGSWLWSAKVWQLMVLRATLAQPVRLPGWWITIPVFLLCFLFRVFLVFVFWCFVFGCLCVGWCAEILTGIEDSHRRLGSKGIGCQTKETGLDSVVLIGCVVDWSKEAVGLFTTEMQGTLLGSYCSM